MIPFTAFTADNNHNDPDAFLHDVRPDYIGAQDGVVCKGIDRLIIKPDDIKRKKLDSRLQDIKGEIRTAKQQREYKDSCGEEFESKWSKLKSVKTKG